MIYRRLLLTIGILLIYRVGAHIPLAGLDTEALTGINGAGRLNGDLLSIFALGVTPIFSVLLVVEVLKMAIPPLGRWQAANDRNAGRLHGYARIAALAMAAFQALGVANGLEDLQGLVPEPGWEFRIGVIVTFVGATALLGWLGDQITRHGIGHGFWLLLITPTLLKLPALAAGSIDLVQTGAIDATTLAVACAYLVAATAALVAVAAPFAARTATGDVGSIDVWPPLIATYLAGFMAVSVALLLDASVSELGGTGSSLRLLLTAALIAALIYWRNATPAGVAQRIWLLALVQILICVVGELLARHLRLPFALSGSWLIVVVAVAMDFLIAAHAGFQASRATAAASS